MFKELKSFWSEIMSEKTISKEETFSMTIPELEKGAKLLHPVGYYVLASNLFKEGQKDESIMWFYVGSIRYRYFLSSIGDDPFHPDNELFGKVQFEVGGSILDYAGGDPEFWAKQIGEARKWDDQNINYFYPKKSKPEALRSVRNDMQELMTKLIDEKEDILRQRVENGAEVRV